MVVTDQMGFKVEVPAKPQRIVSLVPSQTELLFDLGLVEQIVGITKFCIHPKEKIKTKTIVGGTKNFHFEVIEALKPDLIIGNKEENYQSGILKLKEKYPVWMSDISDLPSALAMMEQIGRITQTIDAALNLSNKIKSSFPKLSSMLAINTAYFIWRNPFMSIGQDTFIHQMLDKCGFRNVFGNLSRYPEITLAQLKAAQPDLILLSTEPYPFQAKHIHEFKDICPTTLVKLVDGELFSWYGSRLQHSVAYFERLIIEVKGGLGL